MPSERFPSWAGSSRWYCGSSWPSGNRRITALVVPRMATAGPCVPMASGRIPATRPGKGRGRRYRAIIGSNRCGGDWRIPLWSSLPHNPRVCAPRFTAGWPTGSQNVTESLAHYLDTARPRAGGAVWLFGYQPGIQAELTANHRVPIPAQQPQTRLTLARVYFLL